MIKIVNPGLLSTIQDLGRHGYQKHGVIVSGVMDERSHRMANLLVGNDEKEATIEMTLIGPVIDFHADALIAVCGADMDPEIDNIKMKQCRPIFVKKGSQLRFGPSKSGCRAYLAVAGGFDVPLVMGSKSTYLRAGIGGFNGRALKRNDKIRLGQAHPHAVKTDWSISPSLIPKVKKTQPIRVMKGRHFELFTQESQQHFFQKAFKISPQSDRMGYRLNGAVLTLTNKQEMITEAVSFGTIQVPADGNPIVLLADRQTTGGYPKIAQIATVDLPLIAQLKPGDHLQFIDISYEEARHLFFQQELEIQELKHGISLKERF